MTCVHRREWNVPLPEPQLVSLTRSVHDKYLCLALAVQVKMYLFFNCLYFFQIHHHCFVPAAGGRFPWGQVYQPYIHLWSSTNYESTCQMVRNLGCSSSVSALIYLGIWYSIILNACPLIRVLLFNSSWTGKYHLLVLSLWLQAQKPEGSDRALWALCDEEGDLQRLHRVEWSHQATGALWAAGHGLWYKWSFSCL